MNSKRSRFKIRIRAGASGRIHYVVCAKRDGSTYAMANTLTQALAYVDRYYSSETPADDSAR